MGRMFGALIEVDQHRERVTERFASDAVGEMPHIAGPDPLEMIALDEFTEEGFNAAALIVELMTGGRIGIGGAFAKRRAQFKSPPREVVAQGESQ